MHRLQERGSVAPLNRGEPDDRPTEQRPWDGTGGGDKLYRRRRLWLLAVVAVAVVVVDQVTKTLAVEHLSGHEVHLVGPLAFRLAYNSGVAFSIGTSLTGLIIVVVVVLVAAIAWFARRVPTTSAAVGAGLVIGGALGNLADRLFRAHHGAVVDFIYTRYWPTFNVADACIVCGCVLVAWTLLRHSPSPRRAGGPAQSESGPDGDAVPDR
jgi:signal peptidase II